jgi:membrane-associated PAP2 superfamily phosphatase
MLNLHGFIMELAARFLSETPKFFKILRTVGIVIGVISGFALVLSGYSEFLSDNLNNIIVQVLMYSGLVSAFISQLTATVEEKKNKMIID